MLRSHWRTIGLLVLLAAVIALTHAHDVAAATGPGGGPSAFPTGPQLGNGGGSGGGTGCGDPDEFGIYSRPALPDGKLPSTRSDPARLGGAASPRPAEGAWVRLAFWLLRFRLGAFR